MIDIRFRLVFLALFVVILSACNPLSVEPAVSCDIKTKTCTATVTNNENREVDYSFEMGYEPQGRPVDPMYDPNIKNEQRFTHWRRNVSVFHSSRGTLEPRQTLTFTAEMPEEFFETPGQSLVQVVVRVEPPNGLSVNSGVYHAYTTVSIKGFYRFPIKTIISCNRDKVVVTVTNSGEWGDRRIGLYLNGDLKQPWQILTIKAGETQTFTTSPAPANTYLIEADVEGHREQNHFDMRDYHGSRTYCVPTQK